MIFSPLYYVNSKFMIERFLTIKNDIIVTKSTNNYISNNNLKIDQKLKDNNLAENKNFVQNFKHYKIFDYGYVAHYYSAISIFKDNPFLGVGQRNFRNACDVVASALVNL